MSKRVAQGRFMVGEYGCRMHSYRCVTLPGQSESSRRVTAQDLAVFLPNSRASRRAFAAASRRRLGTRRAQRSECDVV